MGGKVEQTGGYNFSKKQKKKIPACQTRCTTLHLRMGVPGGEAMRVLAPWILLECVLKGTYNIPHSKKIPVDAYTFEFCK